MSPLRKTWHHLLYMEVCVFFFEGTMTDLVIQLVKIVLISIEPRSNAHPH